jgi:excisionase family DNA binding protein
MVDDLITTTEAAERLERSPRYVLQLINRGELEVRRIGPKTRGGQWLVSVASIDALLERWETDPPRRGRPADKTPSVSALARRRSRERQSEEQTR